MLDFVKAMKKTWWVFFCTFLIGGVVGFYEGMAKVEEIYSYKPINQGTEAPGELIGDVNCDGLVDACDASIILEYYSAMSTEGKSNLQMSYDIADVNHDGLIDVCDASAILAYYSELSTDNPRPLWPFEESIEDFPEYTSLDTTNWPTN